MKTNFSTTWMAIAGLTLSLSSFVKSQEEKPRRAPEPPASRSESNEGANSLFLALDRNRDGKLQQNEIDMAVVVLRRMDQDGDGVVTSNELKVPPRRPGNFNSRRQGTNQDARRPDAQNPNAPPRRTFSLAQYDADEDGKISKEEAPERLKERFDDADGNGDGFIDKEEQSAMFEAIRRRFQQGQGRQPNRANRPDRNAGQGESERPKRPPVEKE